MASSWPGSQSRMILRGWALLAAEVLIPQVCHADLGGSGAKARIFLTHFHTPRILRAQPQEVPLVRNDRPGCWSFRRDEYRRHHRPLAVLRPWRGPPRAIAVGQYLGFALILAATLLVVWGAGAFLPPGAIPYFGLIPLVIGLQAAWEAWRGEEEDATAGKKVAAGTVAAVTFANGGDNIGVYVPVFLNLDATGVAVFCVIFLVLVGVLVWLAKFIATRPGIDEILERFEQILFPLVLIILGVVILVQGHAFGL